ncbi:MAG: hypothetical protein SGPRY_005402, partial [Prymnesium sp.]
MWAFLGLLLASPEPQECAGWAAAGECAANPSFMRLHCAAACAHSKGVTSQIEQECSGYAKQGECVRNPAFMLSTCRAHCEAWEEAQGLRIDRDGACVERSLLGWCELENEWMKQSCNTSCTVARRCASSSFTGWSVGVCDKALRCEAIEKSWCAEAANSGQCRSEPLKMARQCLPSCAARDVDAILSAQRPLMRARLSPLYDVSAGYARARERCWLRGWAGHNTHKLMLPTTCSAPRRSAWEARRRPRAYRKADPNDAMSCPDDVSVNTPRVPWKDRYVSVPPHTMHSVRVQQVAASPRIRLLHNFTTPAEAAEILRLAEPRFGRSPVRSVATSRRTSSTATLGFGASNSAVSSIRARIAAFSGYDESMLEPLQVVRYHAGEKYEAHHDLFDLCDFDQKPRRHVTFLIYLNDMPDEQGGHTTFPRLNLRVRPQAGMALVFNDVIDSGMDDERTEHSGTAPSSG